MGEFRKTPTKCWLKNFKLEHLSENFERNGFETVGSIAAMDMSDLDLIFPELKLGERRILQQQITIAKKKDLEPSVTSTSTHASNRSVTAEKPSTRKKLTYYESKNLKDKPVLSPLESYLEQQRRAINEQEKKVRQCQNDIEQFTVERTAFSSANSSQPSCSKCHKKERHNRLNCPYPSPCLSATFCKNIEKHPDDKQFLKQKNKQLSEERRSLQALKTELENEQRSCISVNNRYSARIKQTLIDSNPNKYIRIVNGKSIEDWRLINRDSKILEKHFKGNIPSPSEARETIENLETLVPTKQNNMATNVNSAKTSVYNPYKKLWEDRGISWPRTRTALERKDHELETSSRTQVHDGSDGTFDTEIHSPHRKKMALTPVSEEDDDFQLALGLQESFRTLPRSFDWVNFEEQTHSEPRTVAAAGTNNDSTSEQGTFPQKQTKPTSNLETLVEAALQLSDSN